MKRARDYSTKAIFLLSAVFFILSARASLFAAGEIITKVDIKGNKRIENDAIISVIESRVGNYFSPEQISLDIKRIYEMGYFQDISIDYSVGALGPELTFIVQERPYISEVSIIGNNDIKEEDIREVITVKDNTLFNPEKVKETATKVKELFEEKGYFLAEINTHIEGDNDEATLVIEVKEGRKIMIKKINLLGNKEIKDSEIYKFMETKEGGTFSWISDSGKFEEKTLQKDLDMIKAFYYTKGFVQLKLEEPQVFMSRDKKWLYITIRIDEGDQFSVGTIDFSGDLAKDSQDIERFKNALDLKEGVIFNSENLRTDIVKLTEHFSNFGYAFANVSPVTKIDKEKRLINITFDADKGRLVYIERINISGNTKTRDKVIRREMRIDEGSLYNGSAIKRSRQRIQNLNFFKEVNLDTKPGSADDKIVINIEVEEGPTGTFSVGAGYSSIDGVVGMVQMTNGNMFGKGQKLSVNAELGGESSNYSVSFTEPYLFDTEVFAGFDVFNTSRDYIEYSSSRTGWGVRVGVPIGEYNRVSARYRFEELEISKVSSTASYLIRQFQGSTKTSSISATLLRDTRDNHMNPTRGAESTLYVEYAGDNLGGDNNFYKSILSSNVFFPAFWDHVVMIHGRIGYARSLKGDPLNIDERFYLGGIHTLRGFEYRSVGPEVVENGQTYILGGDKELLFNFEYIVPISKDAGLMGLVFFDAGNAFALDEDYDFTNLRQTAGYGFRWYSPVGPLRLEWGKVLDKREGEKDSRWEFSIGTFF